MSVTDIIIVIAVAGGLILGYSKGAIRQVSSVVGVAAGVIACRLAGPKAVGFAASLMGNETAPDASQVATFVGYAGLFFLVWLAVWLICRILRQATHALMLGPLDGVAGAVFLSFKWLTVLSMAFNLWLLIDPDTPLFASALSAKVTELAPALFGFIKEMATNSELKML